MIEMSARGQLERLSDLADRVLETSILATSLRILAQVPARLKGGRPVTSDERRQLENQGNTCGDWSRVHLLQAIGLDTIRNNRFEGDILLEGFRGTCTGPDGRSWATGMTDCRVRDALIGNACLDGIARLESQYIADGAILVGLGEVTCPAPTLFSFGQALHPGTETSARCVWIWDELTLDDCMAMLSLNAQDQGVFQAKLDSALAPLYSQFGYVGPGAALLHTRLVHSAWIGPGTMVSGASLIRESALLSTPEETCQVLTDGWVEFSLLQPGAHVEASGRVSRSVLLEHSGVSWGGMVSQSIVGPNSSVHKGELNASVIGPFVGFHHQSLLISALWPEGRGNIAYGANVGSNHTGKKPDQEIRPGEGNFFGLGCSIKYPANYADAPYSIFATGITTLPQRLAFPFSLINQPSAALPELGPAINEIVPGWMWSDNAYSLVRRSYKFADSDLAHRHDFRADPASAHKPGFFTSRIFSLDLARQVHKAYRALRAAPPERAYYLEAQIPGLGKNFLRGPVLVQSIAAYQDYLAFFLMKVFADQPRAAWSRELQEMVIAIGGDLGVELRSDLRTDLEMKGAIGGFLQTQKVRLSALKAGILNSLEREDRRGRQIFDDYGDFHLPPEADRTVVRLSLDLAALGERVDAFITAN